jgi:hypothetical protein
VSVLTNFADLFRGRTDAIGLDRGGVEHREVTRGDYEGHLAGHRAIGIFPMLPGDVVWFGAIDLDEPDFDLARQLQGWLPFPAWVEKSRSGNAHVWVFFEKPAPAWAVREVLRAATEAVRRRDVEIFPKQDQLRPGMVGNYINLPLFGEERPILSPRNTRGQHRAFVLREMLGRRHDPHRWIRRAERLGGRPPEDRATSEFGTQKVVHRCADYIMEHRESNPLQPGHRHVVLFHLAKMFLNWEASTPEEVIEWVRLVNEAGAYPVSDNELVRIVQNAQRGEFTSTGCDDPIMAPYVDPNCPIANA